MLDNQSFRQHAHRMVDWMADYLDQVAQYPVKSQVAPRALYDQLPPAAPVEGEDMDQILADFERLIMPGITHWQSPNFMAYFPANGSYPSLLAEMLTATLGAQCMIWETSPAAAELEEKMMNWLGQLIGVPDSWAGVIQSTASDASLCAILSARERASAFAVNAHGLQGAPRYRVYGSAELHASVEKDVKIAGLGRDNYVRIPVDASLAMRPEALAEAITADLAQGYQPLCVVAAIGTTSSTAIDPLPAIAELCTRHGIWLHVDAAYAGAALILPECQAMIQGIEQADSLVFNPHKWLFTHFDCSAYFVKDPASLVQTFEISPEYLKTGVDQQVNNYRDWGVPLGRRFRALKLWFVMRSFGVAQMQAILRQHIAWAQELAQQLQAEPAFDLLAPVPLNLICFRYHPPGLDDEATLDQLNQQLLATLNATGQLYLTHTRLHGRYVLRLVAGQTNLERQHLQAAWQLIRATALASAE
jgi:aromatic-L-amino-acid decarboxylase